MTGLLALLALLFALAPAFAAAPPAEVRAFDAAAKAFNDGFHDRAEKQLADFAVKYSESELLPQAQLLRGQALFQLKQFERAIQFLGAQLAAAGALADQYRYTIAEAQFQLGKFREAADAFAALLKDFPDTTRRLDAAYREAAARFKVGDAARAITLLGDRQGAFRLAAAKQKSAEAAVRGVLLLAEAYLQKQSFAEALDTVKSLNPLKLEGELAWLRQYWLTRAQAESGTLDAALASVKPLTALATAAGGKELLADTMALHGDILARLKRPADAIKAYEKNLDAKLAPERRRQALLKITELSLAQNEPDKSVGWLERFLKDNAADPSLDIIRLTLGELRLREYFQLGQSALAAEARAVAQSNRLVQARVQLDLFLKEFAHSPLVGKANLNRGLALWEEGRVPESQAAFQVAVQQLPFGEDQAMAKFKLADAQYRQNDFTNAVANYRAMIDQYGALPEIRDGLFDQVLYQLVRASIALGDLNTANDALNKILTWYPLSFYGDRSLLMVGQALNRRGQPPEARIVFVDFLKRFENSSLAPEVHLAIARTYVQEQNWTAAIGKFDDWVRANPSHPAIARAEFDRAWVRSQAGRHTEALAMFTDFIRRFPTNELAPFTQNWLADHHFNAGAYVDAEKNYQLLYQNTNWPPTELTRNARIMAGRAALARQNYKDAQEHFKEVINDEKSPPDLAATAWFALGDAISAEPIADAAKAVDKFASAINAFGRIIQNFPNDRLVPLALGRIGDCHFQLAAQVPGRYEPASESYRKVTEHPLADVAARSQAEVGLGLVQQKLAAMRPTAEQKEPLEQALKFFLNVVYGNNLRDGETSDGSWVKVAAEAAGALLEAQGRLEEAVNVYLRAGKTVPALRPAMEKRIESLKSRGAAPK
ncbi:MAG: tetratricopeptide repeat protein [Verrucomicrobia bacterium]|nr:tetratricopeptide repeat protein [Verrucomicrobiota bacterium]